MSNTAVAEFVEELMLCSDADLDDRVRLRQNVYDMRMKGRWSMGQVGSGGEHCLREETS